MMDMPERITELVNALAESFYKLVPHELSTYCSVTSKISQRVLQHFGIEATLVPCQIWLTTPEQNFVVGFTGEPAAPGKWNGHVVCGTRDLIIDAALHNFTRDFALTLPRIAACRRFNVLSQVIARLDLNRQNALWWHHPPHCGQIDLNIPAEPPGLIAKYAAQLIEYIAATQTVLVNNVAPGVARMPDRYRPL